MPILLVDDEYIDAWAGRSVGWLAGLPPPSFEEANSRVVCKSNWEETNPALSANPQWRRSKTTQLKYTMYLFCMYNVSLPWYFNKFLSNFDIEGKWQLVINLITSFVSLCTVYLSPYMCNVCIVYIVDQLTWQCAATHWSRTSGDSIATPGTRLQFYRFSSNHRVIKLLQISCCVTLGNCAKNRLVLRVRWPIGHACAHTLWPFSDPCHIGHKAILLLLLEQSEGYMWRLLMQQYKEYVKHSFGRKFELNCSWILRWLVFQTSVSSCSEKYFDSSRSRPSCSMGLI